jgi:hypothetical protein
LPLAGSKVVGAVLPAFKTRIVHRQTICRISNLARLPIAGFQKLSVQLGDICHPIGAKDLNYPVLKAFSKLKSSGIERLKTFNSE